MAVIIKLGDILLKYTNTLPDIPFDPKSIKYPFSRNRFIKVIISYEPHTLKLRPGGRGSNSRNDLGV